MRLPRLLALRDAAIEAPVGPERLYYLVEIVGQTKDAPCGQIGPALLEVVQNGRRPWHLEANHDRGQRPEIVRILVEVGLHDVAVEGHVERLVLGDAPHRRPERRLLVATGPSHAQIE